MRLTFDEIPDGWELRNLGGVEGLKPACEFLDHKRVPVNATERSRRVGPYPYYGANGLQGQIDNFIFDEPLVLLAEDGGFFFDGERPVTYRVDGKCWVNNHAHVLRPLADVDRDWLHWAIAFQEITHLIPEPIRPKLNQAKAKQIVVPLPPLAEQQRIVARVEALTRRLAQARQARQAALAEAQPMLNSLREDIYQKLLNEFPNKPLGKCGEVLGGGTPSKADEGYWNGNIPWVTAREMWEFDVTDTSLKITERAVKETTVKLVPPGSVLFVVRGSILFKRVPVSVNRVQCTINQDMKAIVPIAELDGDFLAQMLWGANEELKGMVDTAGNSAGKLPTERWETLPIPIPPPREQKKVIARLDTMRGKLDELQRLQREVAAELASFTPALLAKAFRGEL